MKPLQLRSLTLVTIILAVALFRLVPHWPNMTPIAALALFGAATFERKWLGLLAPLAAMLLSDALIGFHSTMGAVYISFGLTWLLGLWAVLPQQTGRTGSAAPGWMAPGWMAPGWMAPGRIAAASVASSVLFFLITNFAVWYGSSYYPQTLPGLMTCYVAGLAFYNGTSFFLNGLLGDLFFTAVLFGGYYLLTLRYTVLKPRIL